MNIFLSKFVNNIDKKGRVSVPANYRNSLGEADFNGIIAYPSFKNGSIEACSLKRLEQLSKVIEQLDPYSEERDAFETIILGEAVQISIDNEGRIIIPQSLLDHAGIKDKVCFVGKGQIFEMWEPGKFNNYLSLARQIAQNSRFSLKNI